MEKIKNMEHIPPIQLDKVETVTFPDITIGTCTRKNLCVDCDDTQCSWCGDISADCPKYECDNPTGDCGTCEFIKEFQESERKRYESEAENE